ncbi:X2-like carbohydrate binding domain-containing protein [Cohnella lupini]|uniref:Alpha-galactosidase n=1 Tax=Cohnella lupini TaxID=1294267 RepID=A0A3D9IN90_9BACL|nr:X2-like carbohydrate binding domain-containing protein [Cohnella lupini]RED63195.1 alpha galactosidase A [Cohnella lupini]
MVTSLKKFRILLLAIIMIATQLGIVLPNTPVARAADNGLGQKPYMGWSSYSLQVYDSLNGGSGSTRITADQIKAQSDAMHEKLQAHGYEYINIDAGWNGGMDGYGRPIPSTTLYPNGFQEVIDYVHNNGQKIGIYGIPGLSPQAYEDDLPIYGTSYSMKDIAYQPLTKIDAWNFGYKIDFSKPGAQEYINSIADLYGEWGIDFLKYDSVMPGSGVNDLSRDSRDDVKAWSKALAPHNIWFELSWALDIKYADYWKQYANGWRVDWDVECYCAESLTNWGSIARLFPLAEQWWRHAGPGGWNDFDSLNVGNGAMDGLTKDERQTAMTLWSISSAQLYTGNDLTNLDSYGIELLTNDEVIAVNQAGRPAHPVSTESDQQVWYANNGDGSYTVALFNLGSSAATVNVNWSDIGLNGPASVRDLYSHTNLGTYDSGYSSINLASHGSRLFKVTSQGGEVSLNDDDTGMKYTGSWKRNDGKELSEAQQNLLISIKDASAENSTISPTTGSFNKEVSAQADVTTTMTLNGNELTSIANGGAILALGTDYTVSGNEVTIKKEYLAKRSVGIAYLTFSFSSGATQTLGITISDTTLKDSKVTPSAISFDRKDAAQADVTTTLTLNGNELSGIAHGETTLVAGTDYTASGNTVTVKKEYLASLPLGTTNLIFSFDAGAAQNVALIVKDSSVGGFITLNDDDDSIVYNGTWNQSTNRGYGDYKDDVHWTETKDNYFEYTFTGTGIELITEMDPSQGAMDIYVDNEFKQTVSTYNLGRLGQQTVYNITGLPNGAHTLKAVMKSGYFMLLDKLTVTLPDRIAPATASFDKSVQAAVYTTINDGSSLDSIANGGSLLTEGTDYTVSGNVVTIKKEYLAAAPIGTTNLTFTFDGGAAQIFAIAVSSSGAEYSKVSINDNDPSISYSGNWGYSTGRGLGDYQDDVHYTETNDAYFEYAFTGTGIDLITEKDSSQGDIDIYVDNEFKQTVSTYNDNRLVQQAVYSISGLSNGPHTIKAVKKSGSYMLLDNFSVSVPVVVNPGPKASINDSDPGITYSGSWGHSTGRGLGDYQDDVHYTEANDAYFEYSFKGTGIDYITEKHSSQGDVDIYLDNEFRQTVSTYSDGRSVQQTVYSITGLSDEVHTFKAVKKSGSYMLLDKLSVSVTVGISPSTGSFDKYASAQADVGTTMTLNGDALSGISLSGTPLTLDTDYTVSGNEVTIKKEYLATRPVGVTSLTFSFGSGAVQTFIVTISDSSPQNSAISPSAVSFDQKASAQADVSTTISFNGNELNGIANGATALAQGIDYTVSGNQVSIKKDYLAALPTGITNLTLTFSEGATQNLAVIVSDTSRGRYVWVNDDDTRITYQGAWSHNRNRGVGDYKDDVHYTETDNASFEFKFKGTGIEVVTEKDPSHGDMDIYVDNEFKQTISTYNVSKQALQTVYNITGLPYGEHTLKAVKKSGYYMLLDQLKFKVEDLIGPDTASFDKNAKTDVKTTLNIDGSNLLGITNGETALELGKDYKLKGNQVTIKKQYLATRPVGTSTLTFSFRGDYRNDVHYTETNNDYFEYTFKGTGIKFISAKGPLQGKVDVYVDNKYKKTVNTHHSSRLVEQTLYGISGLENGTHTIKVVKKSGDYMIADKLSFTVPSQTIVNDSNAAIKYSSGWTHSTNRGLGDYQDDVHSHNAAPFNPPYFQYKFTGTGIEIITEKNALQGEFNVYVDGVFKSTVNTYSPTLQVQQTVYSIQGLSPGTHTIKVLKKSGLKMTLDSLRVTH